MNTCMDPLSHNSYPLKLLFHNNRLALGLSRPEKGPPESSQAKKKKTLPLQGLWLGHGLGMGPNLIKNDENVLSTLGTR